MLYQQNYRFKVVRLGNSKGLGSSKLQWSFETSRFEMKKRDFNWVLPTSIHTQRFAVIISFRRIFLTLRQLSHAQIIYFYLADASARTSSDTASTCIASKQLYFRTKVIECFLKLYYKTKENYTLNSNNL